MEFPAFTAYFFQEHTYYPFIPKLTYPKYAWRVGILQNRG
jgi:hypothetical protein